MGFTDAGCVFRGSWQGREGVPFITISFGCQQVSLGGLES